MIIVIFISITIVRECYNAIEKCVFKSDRSQPLTNLICVYIFLRAGCPGLLWFVNGSNKFYFAAAIASLNIPVVCTQSPPSASTRICIQREWSYVAHGTCNLNMVYVQTSATQCSSVALSTTVYQRQTCTASDVIRTL